MHDLLSARVHSFESQGRALDCTYISEETEIRWLNGADTLLAAQVREAEVIAPKVHARVLVLPVTMRAQTPSPHPEPGRCLFVGSRIAPNENALNWLLAEVWPIVRTHCPQATLAIVGTVAHAPEGNTAPNVEAGVEAIGPVPSLDAEYQRASVCLVPLRIGSGIKIKLLEALSFGKAIVTTSVGVEGLEEVASEVVDIADDPSTFAAHIVALLTDDGARQAHEQAAYALARTQFDPLRQLEPAFLAALL
jgi:succinoglycan biosynthesis protein ExoO